MKTLTLLRHAKAGWDDRSLSDFERPLTERGRRAARAMGRHLRELGLGFDRVVVSPAARTLETVAVLAETYGPFDAVEDERIYLAPVETLIEIVRETDDAQTRLLIVGHNPGMERLALLLGGGPLHEAVAVKYPTGALAEIALPAARWRDVGEASGTLVRFVRPRDLDPALGPGG